MNYGEFTDWMFDLERFGIKLGLDNMKEFLDRLGNPERRLRAIHVTGTNGKGSVCVMIASILRAHGLRVGLYTSPHLIDFRERISINGRRISERDVVRLGLELKGVMEAMASENRERQLTFFEFTTGLAFEYFAQKEVDIVVAEVGMGGRLDATNVLRPEVSVITRIGLEHTSYLGATIPDIAREKAGIIKNGVDVVTCERRPEALAVMESVAARKGSNVIRIGKDFDVSSLTQATDGTGFDYHGMRTIAGLHTRLLGSHQAENAATAIAALERLKMPDLNTTNDHIRKGLASVRWPGRLDMVSRRPLVIFDGSHNPEGVATTVSVLRLLELKPLTFVVGCMDDKDARGIVKALVPLASKILVTQARYKRALAAGTLMDIVRQEFAGESEVYPDATSAFEAGLGCMQGKGLCVIGSLYLVGEAIQWWDEQKTPAHKV